MTVISSHIMVPYTRYGYPVITETSADDRLAQYEENRSRFDNSSFFKNFRKNPFAFNPDKGAGLYTKKKRLEPLAMQMIGTAIDLYA